MSKITFFTPLAALAMMSNLSASFDSLVNDLGLAKDSQIATTRNKLSEIFDVRESAPQPAPKKGVKVEVKRTPLEVNILKLHKAIIDLGVETHPVDRELWKSFLLNLNGMLGLTESVRPVFRKNQISELGKSLSGLGESYEREGVAYFSLKKPQMLGKAIAAVDKIEARYLALFAVHEFMAQYWAADQTEFVAPLMTTAIKLSQAKLIEDVFEKEFETQLNQQREERRKIKLEKEKERLEEERRLKKEREKEKAEEEKLKEEKSDDVEDTPPTPEEAISKKEDTPEDSREKVEGPELPPESSLPEEPEEPELTRDEITLKHGSVLEKLKGKFLPIEVESWDLEANLTYDDLKILLEKYQTPFDEIANLTFPKPKLPEPKKEEPEEVNPEKKDDVSVNLDLEKTEEPEVPIKEEKMEVVEIPPYEIPGPLKTFKHPGIFSMIKAKLGVEKAEEYLFLRCLGLLEEMQNEKSDKEKLMGKLKRKWRLHITQGKDSDPEKVTEEDKNFTAFLKAYTEWALQNKELRGVRSQLESSNPLKEKYDRFMKEQGEKFKSLEEEKAKQLLTMMVGPQAWVYHQSLQKKSEPKGNVKPMEETLRKIWLESILKPPSLSKKTLDSVLGESESSFDPKNFVF